jgi:hypothetical protein
MASVFFECHCVLLNDGPCMLWLHPHGWDGMHSMRRSLGTCSQCLQDHTRVQQRIDVDKECRTYASGHMNTSVCFVLKAQSYVLP